MHASSFRQSQLFRNSPDVAGAMLTSRTISWQRPHVCISPCRVSISAAACACASIIASASAAALSSISTTSKGTSRSSHCASAARRDFRSCESTCSSSSPSVSVRSGTLCSSPSRAARAAMSRLVPRWTPPPAGEADAAAPRGSALAPHGTLLTPVLPPLLPLHSRWVLRCHEGCP